MASALFDNLLGDFLGPAAVEASGAGMPLSNPQKVVLAATAITSYVISRALFSLLGLPAIPKISTLLLQDQPIYAPLIAMAVLVGLTLLAIPFVRGIRHDAPVFCAAIGLLALPTHSGDMRNALLDAGTASVYGKMIIELALLTVAIFAAYLVLGKRTPPVVNELDPAAAAAVEEPQIDTMADRLMVVGVQALVTIGLLALLGQSPVKGQAIIGVALAGGLASWLTYKSRVVRGSAWYVAGTLLAGAAAYAWTGLHPEGIELGDTRGYLAGAARSLPLHYATAGVAGTIYGYWAGRSSGQVE